MRHLKRTCLLCKSYIVWEHAAAFERNSLNVQKCWVGTQSETDETLPSTTSRHLPLTIATFQVWGANTAVGKTIVSAALVKEAIRSNQACYLKPVQTGFPQDSDARLVVDCLPPRTLPSAANACNFFETVGAHAAILAPADKARTLDYSRSVIHVESAWKAPVSPHIAVAEEGRPVTSEEMLNSVIKHIQAFAQNQVEQGSRSTSQPRLALVETAGGPGSPGPSGQLQCEAYRSLRLPALLVGDGRLGGISASLAACEMLTSRGYDVAALVLLETPQKSNSAALAAHLASGVAPPPLVVSLPLCPGPEPGHEADPENIDAKLTEWLKDSQPEIQNLLHHLLEYHKQRVSRLEKLPERTLRSIWYPFTQHRGLGPSDITTVDSRSGQHLCVFPTPDPSAARLEPHYDACASWWTQGVSGELHGKLVAATMQGVARFGHVLHPNVAIDPTVDLAELLLGSVGKGWASRVFYSDDGSTAVEVALKMAFRKFWKDHPELGQGGDLKHEFRVCGIEGGYHGDTLGAMDAVAPSPYNGPAQYPWYKGRGLFLRAPYVGLSRGQWVLRSERFRGPPWRTLDDIFDASREGSELAQQYTQLIDQALDEEEGGKGPSRRVAACIVEPVLQGAGGMAMVDPLFQRRLVAACRSRRIPVIFDEVFTGLWRLGRPAAAHLLRLNPDIACYAKLLTGGLLPLSATLASADVFEAFSGESKLEALLHGHSYSGHAAGAAAGAAALRIFSDPRLNRALQEDGQALRQLWPQSLVDRLSYLPAVRWVFALGTVLAAELRAADGGGYASSISAEVVQELRQRGIFARPLGSVIYLMVTPTTQPVEAASLLQTLSRILDSRTTS